MIMEGITSAVIKEIAEVAKEIIKKEIEELPEEIGELSEVETLVEEIGEELEPNSSYEIDGIKYETDDNGQVFKVDGKLAPDIEYVCNGIKYKTDSNGEIISWEGKPFYNPEGERDGDAQTEAGGEDRKPGDDGGHLVARVTGGSAGNENLVPMRDTINRGDYKKAENEIVTALKNGSEVTEKGTVIREGSDSRPTKVEMQYSYDDVNKTLIVDNVEGSLDLLQELEGVISQEDFESLMDEINDMIEDDSEVSVTSVLKEFDENGNIKSITVGLRDETLGEKSYRTFDALQEG
ncbi:DNA/RNA non-specific endonuclease [Clostridium collagenovorans DSM 3089]|uniref:DNA/RNA non-specific endonuclease n=1 Tax=Clostridium collagenovorans DSM 3089 TaxID=1121306 RepID=A0A1M5XG23_9CLOT|nr:DNA/RNA non-specific endonuclease [Clostridium collagenovorans]SHH98183.1 DNA/RNA non-specific endonuclease [Clostridium collagenovorans DSM 3089]